MIRSMTAFGRADVTSSFGRIVVEIQSVNRKFLDPVVMLPPELGRFETDIRLWLAERIHRGRVQLTYRIEAAPQYARKLRINPAVTRQMREALREVNGENPSPITPTDFARIEGWVDYDLDFAEAEHYLEAIKQATEEALDAFDVMKKSEG